VRCHGGPWDGRDVPPERYGYAHTFHINDPDQIYQVILGQDILATAEPWRVGTYTRVQWSRGPDTYLWQGWQ
jgi:hypothetical protein